jgi:hypothetical protein
MKKYPQIQLFFCHISVGAFIASKIIKPRECCFEIVVNILACYMKFSESPKTDKVPISAKRGYRVPVFFCAAIPWKNLTGLYSHNDTLNTLLKKFHFYMAFAQLVLVKKYCI